MTNDLFTSPLETRKAEIKRQIATLTTELEEIETAEKVISRYGISPVVAAANRVAKPRRPAVDPEAPATMTGKIFKIVSEGAAKEPADVLAAIRARWLPDVDGNDVRPTLWRLVQEKRIIKDASGYRLAEGP
jgi:preprotein translocase subunit SecD